MMLSEYYCQRLEGVLPFDINESSNELIAATATADLFRDFVSNVNYGTHAYILLNTLTQLSKHDKNPQGHGPYS